METQYGKEFNFKVRVVYVKKPGRIWKKTIITTFAEVRDPWTKRL